MADKATREELRFERLLEAPIDQVWRYIVEPELRATWFMAGPTDLREGGSFGMTMDHDRLSDDNVPIPDRFKPYDGNSWSEKILALDPPKLLIIEWEEAKAGTVTFALSQKEGGKTRLILTHAGLRGREDAAKFGGGWASHLVVLERRLRGERVSNFWTIHAHAENEIRAALE